MSYFSTSRKIFQAFLPGKDFRGVEEISAAGVFASPGNGDRFLPSSDDDDLTTLGEMEKGISFSGRGIKLPFFFFFFEEWILRADGFFFFFAAAAKWNLSGARVLGWIFNTGDEFDTFDVNVTSNETWLDIALQILTNVTRNEIRLCETRRVSVR